MTRIRAPLPINRTPAWSALQVHARRQSRFSLQQAFQTDPHRAENLSVVTEHVFFDYSRQLVDSRTIRLLIELARTAGVSGRIEAMFRGNKVNTTENRAALHTALRDPNGKAVLVDKHDVKPAIREVLEKVRKFAERIHSGEWKGTTGKHIKNVVAIGIGGSYLGPEFLAEACRAYAKKGINLKFVANVDATDFHQKVEGLDPAETLFIVVSKTFTTAETMKNAETAKVWIQHALGDKPEVIKKHFVAVSTATEKVKEFGIDGENMFGFWDWVGGRYSATSAVGAVPLSLFLGYDKFEEILKGAHWMDGHFQRASFDKNIPVLSALIDIWNINFLGLRIRALLPYCQALSRLPAHTQQVEMESNGKLVDRWGRKVKYATGEVVFGEAGTNGQHSFYQLMHQGAVLPADFIGFIRPQPGYDTGIADVHHVTPHQELTANLFAQAEALALGKPEANQPEKVFHGNRPSSILLFDQLTPFTAGALLAWTEHRTVVKGFLWGINPFDQFGVELGKALGVCVRNEILQLNTTGRHQVDPTAFPASHAALNIFLRGKLPPPT